MFVPGSSYMFQGSYVNGASHGPNLNGMWTCVSYGNQPSQQVFTRNGYKLIKKTRDPYNWTQISPTNGYSMVKGTFVQNTNNPPSPKEPCDDLHNYGHVLWEKGFQEKDEAINFMHQSSVKRIAAFDDVSYQALMDVKNANETGGTWQKNCTNNSINDYICKIIKVDYIYIPELDVSVANYTFEGLSRRYYVGPNGYLCRFVLLSNPDPGPKIGPEIIPPKQEIQYIEKVIYGAGQVYAPIYSEDILPETKEIVTNPLWSDSATILTSPTSESLSDSSSFDYILKVYQQDSSSCGAEEQFRIIYADYYGSGSRDLGGLDNETLTKAMYTQYAHILLPGGTEKFTINNTEEDYVYIVDVRRDRYIESMDPGNWQLSLYSITDSAGAITTDTDLSTISANKLELTYVDASITGSNVTLTNKIYDIFGGTIEDKIGVKSDGTEVTGSYSASIGKFYPNHGVMVFAGSQLDLLYGFNTNRNTERNGMNTVRMFRAIEAPTVNSDTDASGDALGFIGRNLDIERSRMYFIRVKNQLFNFTNNPTFVSGSEGEIIDKLKDREIVYFTTVGLYNKDKELLAVGKTSKPIESSATEESLFNVKIKY